MTAMSYLALIPLLYSIKAVHAKKALDFVFCIFHAKISKTQFVKWEGKHRLDGAD